MNETKMVEEIDMNAMDEEIEEELKANVTVAIQTEVLKNYVTKVERSIAKKSVQDVFKMIYINVSENELIFKGINNDYLTEAKLSNDEEQTSFKITSGNPGSVCFPGSKFVEIVKKLQHKNTEIKIENNNATIKSGRAKFDLNGLGGDEFPRTPDLNASVSVSIHPDVLGTIYEKTTYAASTKETKPVLTGVNHRLKGKELKCVSTDAHRLAQYVYELDEEYSDVNMTIPVHIISEIQKHLRNTSIEVKIHFCDNQVVYEIDDVFIYGRIFDISYPDTDRFIVDSCNASVIFQAGSLKALLGRSTTFNPDQPILIRIKSSLNQCRVNTREAEVGAFQEDIVTSEGTGEDIALAVNVRYLQEALSRFNDEDYIKFEFLGALKPFTARLVNGNVHCLDLFIPVRTNQLDPEADVVIEGFQGEPELDFNPFSEDFEEIE